MQNLAEELGVVPRRKPGDEDTRKKGKWMPGATPTQLSSCQATFYLLSFPQSSQNTRVDSSVDGRGPNPGRLEWGGKRSRLEIGVLVLFCHELPSPCESVFLSTVK